MTDRIVSFGIVSAAIIGLVAVALFLFGQPLFAKAGLTTFAAPCKTATATSSLSYMTAGTATTTLVCGMGSDGADMATLAIQVNASSTDSTFNLFAEESMDGQDYYPIVANEFSTTTYPLNLHLRAYSTFTFASSTIGGAGLGVGLLGASTTYQGFEAENNRNHYELSIPVRMKYVRVYAVMAIGSAPGAIWMQIQPKAGI